MHLDSAKKLLDVLCENANRVIYGGFGIGPAESTFFEIVRLVRSHNDLKEYALEKVSAVMEGPNGGASENSEMPTELVELLAHEFRWPEFQSLAEQRIQDCFGGDRALAISDLSLHVLEAMQDDWEDRIFYQRYRSK